jgi:hypothetical protein
MNSSNIFSTRNKLLIASFALLAVLLASGALSSSGAFSLTNNNSSTNVTSTPSLASSSLGVPSSSSYFGPAAKFLVQVSNNPSGTYETHPTVLSASAALSASNNIGSEPNLNPRPATDHSLSSLISQSVTVPPTVNCVTASSMCVSVSNSKGGAVSNPDGVNAVDSGGAYGEDIEPPDQSVCAGNGYVMQVENLGELEVFSSKLAQESGVITLDSLMGLTTIPSSIGGPWSSGGDIQCLYDYGNGGHWFVTEFVSNSSEASGGTFAGCFAGKYLGCMEGIAVSVSNNPLGAYNVYFLNPNRVNNDPGTGYLLNDFAKQGNTQNAWLLSYDEFNLNGVPACPAYGCYGFNGAQQFAFNKNALELGFPVVEPFGNPDPYFNVAYVNMGTDPALYPVPANPPFQPANASCFSGTYAGYVCWFQAIPAMSPDPTQFDNNNGGTGFVVSGGDFFGLGDNREAAFAWTHLSDLDSNSCSLCSGIKFGGQIFTGLNAYIDEGQACLAESGGNCGLGMQKTGDTPLGTNCVAFGLTSASAAPNGCPESGIASNFDGVTQVSYADGQIWFGISTLINQTYASSSAIHLGIAYWVVGTSSYVGAHPTFTLTDQGYVTAMNSDEEFPAFAAIDGGLALLDFTVNGANYFPSSAFGLLNDSSNGLMGSMAHVADMGRSPQDGFSEYQNYNVSNTGSLTTRPRWGDYNAAIYEPSSPGSSTGNVYFATEFINAPQCTSSHFLKDSSCGMTRDPFANWGNSLNYLPVS